MTREVVFPSTLAGERTLLMETTAILLSRERSSCGYSCPVGSSATT
jgi:hypothetical protein